MAARISIYTMTAWSGVVPPMANQVSARERAGTDGYTFCLQGKRSRVFQITTTSLHTDIATARARCADYEALIASFVPLEDPSGRSYGKVLVLDVSAQARRLLHSTDGSHASVEATWSLQRGR
jgi:hypothetical protein